MRLLLSMVIVVVTLSVETTCSISKGKGFASADRRYVQKRNAAFPMGNRFQNRPIQHDSMSIFEDIPWSDFTPNTPSPEEVDCQIEIHVTREVGGRCVRLGGMMRMPVCQSGSNLGFSGHRCAEILAEREAEQATLVQQQQQQQQPHHGVNKRSVASRDNSLEDMEHTNSKDN